MRIVFCDLKLFYHQVLSVTQKKRLVYSFDPIPLPHPLTTSSLIIEKREKFFSVNFPIVSEKTTLFDNSSKRIANKITSELEYECSIQNENGCLLIKEKEGKFNHMSILDPHINRSNQRGIYLGSGGAKKIPLDGPEKFAEELKKLENVVNIAVVEWLNPLIKRGTIPKLNQDYLLVNP